MPAQATCPRCELTIRVPVDYAGKSVKCPQCQQRFVVGGARAPETVAPSVEPTNPSASVRTAPLPNFDAIVMKVLSEDE